MADRFIPCSVDSCEGNAAIRGACIGRRLCRPHYKRLLRHGDPLSGGTPMGARGKWIEEHKNYSGDDCLKWPFSYLSHGYGQIKINGKSTLASHAMCIAAHGPKPGDDYQAAHSCGNGNMGCVNPNHIRWATRDENEKDKEIHGTLCRGERQGGSKLKYQDVIEIRSLAGKMYERQIAKKYGVNRATIGKIIRRERWAWLP